METPDFEPITTGSEEPVSPDKKDDVKKGLNIPKQSDAAKRHSEELLDLQRKHLNKEFKTSGEEVAAYQDYEIESDELDE